MPEYVTPLMQQFAAIKAQHPDCLILFRLGDFYELFAEDARVGAEILDITLTRKAQSKGGDVPMAGVPFHALDAYLPRLIEAGHKVAIVEQLVPADGKTLVEREVVRIVTPGTFVPSGAATETRRVLDHRTCAVLLQDDHQAVLAFGDLSTGDILFTSTPLSSKLANPEFYDWLQRELERFLPAELLVTRGQETKPELQTLSRNLPFLLSNFSGWEEWSIAAADRLRGHLKVKSLEAFDLDQQPLAQQAVAILIGYATYTQRQSVPHLRQIRAYQPEAGLQIDLATQRNLELFISLRHHDTRGTLIQFLDQAVTALGSRTLRNWLRHPSTQLSVLQERLHSVEELVNHPAHLTTLRTHLKEIGDIERLTGRVTLRLSTPRDVLRLGTSLEAALKLNQTLQKSQSVLLQPLDQKIIQKLQALATTILATIDPQTPNDPLQGGVVKNGIDKQLDTWRQTLSTQNQWMVEYEQRLRRETGISTLRVRSNKVFGFYIEVSRGAVEKVPPTFERKQTLVNGERYSTPELKQEELALLTAAEHIQQKELQLLADLLNVIQTHTIELQLLAKHLGSIDCLACFATLTHAHKLTRPALQPTGPLSIQGGRHPVVEAALPQGDFIPNDTDLDSNQRAIIILTGPNMGGKSVYIRQIAMIVLLAHIGCFVPAQQATVPITDRIFVRSGAADNIAEGLSTFLVEMVETASILRHATARSLVLLDEVGRGTSTYDGLSLAWAIVEFLATRSEGSPKTIFATHYLELQQLAEVFPTVANAQVAVHQAQQEVVFLHQIQSGGAEHSFGIHVAAMAGLPEAVLQRARVLLQEFEEHRQGSNQTRAERKILSELQVLDLNNLTPAQAVTKLETWQKLCKET